MTKAEATMAARIAVDQRDTAQARLSAALDALSSLLAAFPELAGSFATHEQQIALRAANALLSECGR